MTFGKRTIAYLIAINIFAIVVCMIFVVRNRREDLAKILANIPPPSLSQPSTKSAVAPVSIPTPNIDDFAEIEERPPFSQTRRPPQPAAPIANTPEEPEPSVTASLGSIALLGVATTPERRIAIFRRQAESALIRLAPGEFLDSWQLVKIDPRHVVFRVGSEEVSIPLARVNGEPGNPTRLPTAVVSRGASSP